MINSACWPFLLRIYRTLYQHHSIYDYSTLSLEVNILAHRWYCC